MAGRENGGGRRRAAKLDVAREMRDGASMDVGEPRRDTSADVEILVLRHAVAMLAAAGRPPALRPANRVLLATLSRLLPQSRLTSER